MSLELVPYVSDPRTSDDDDLIHHACCDDDDPAAPMAALCGAVCTDEPQFTDEDANCVVCVDLDQANWCPRYGRCLWPNTG